MLQWIEKIISYLGYNNYKGVHRAEASMFVLRYAYNFSLLLSDTSILRNLLSDIEVIYGVVDR